MNPLELHIKTTADLKAAKDAVKTYEDLIKNTKAFGGDSKVLEDELARLKATLAGAAAAAVRDAADLEKVIATTKRLGGDTKALEQTLATMKAKIGKDGFFAGMAAKGKEIQTAYKEAGGGVAGMFAAIGATGPATIAALAGISAGINLVIKGVREYAEAETAVYKLNAALALNNQLSQQTSDQYQHLADALEEATKIPATQWLQVMTRLTQFGADPSNIKKYVQAVEDLAGMLDGDLPTAADIMSKALEGNFEALTRWGIAIDDAAPQAEKLAVAIEQIGKRGHGILRSSMAGVTGEVAAMDNAYKNLMQHTGGWIGMMSGAFGGPENVAKFLNWLDKPFANTIQKQKDLANVTKESERSNKSFAASLETIFYQTQKVTNALQAKGNALKENERQQDEVADAQMALELAKVDAAEKGGKMNSSDATAARVGIRRQAEINKFQRSQQTARDQVALLKQEENALKSGVAKAGIIAQNAQKEYDANKTPQNLSELKKARQAAMEIGDAAFPRFQVLSEQMNSIEGARAHEARVQTIKGQTSILTGETEIAQSHPGVTGPRSITPAGLQVESMRQFGISAASQNAASYGNAMKDVETQLETIFGALISYVQGLGTTVRNLQSRVDTLNNS